MFQRAHESSYSDAKKSMQEQAINAPLTLKSSCDDEIQPTIKLIRVPDETATSVSTVDGILEPPVKKPKSRQNLEIRLNGKENTNKNSKRSNVKNKTKASKKLILPPGQKTLKQFFSP